MWKCFQGVGLHILQYNVGRNISHIELELAAQKKNNGLL